MKRKKSAAARESRGVGIHCVDEWAHFRGQLLFTIALSGPLVFQTVFRVDEQGFALDLHFTPGSTVHPNSCVKLQVHYSLLEFFFIGFEILTQTSFELITDSRLIP